MVLKKKELNTKGTKRAENAKIKAKKMVSITAGTNKNKSVVVRSDW